MIFVILRRIHHSERAQIRRSRRSHEAGTEFRDCCSDAGVRTASNRRAESRTSMTRDLSRCLRALSSISSVMTVLAAQSSPADVKVPAMSCPIPKLLLPRREALGSVMMWWTLNLSSTPLPQSHATPRHTSSDPRADLQGHWQRTTK